MNNNDNLQSHLDRGQALLALCRRVDYAAVIMHQPAAVATLQDVVRTLREESLIVPDSSVVATGAGVEPDFKGEPDLNNDPDLNSESASKSAVLERHRRFVEALGRAGLGDRLGKLYCSTVERRQIAFRDVPHKLGLPQFDMVVAPDYAPLSGYHGIFIGAQEVASCVLPLPAESHQWQVRERHRFAALEQVVDLVSLLSAGFPVG